jgi:hypothetical protein
VLPLRIYGGWHASPRKQPLLLLQWDVAKTEGVRYAELQVDQVDAVVWEWIRAILEHPEIATKGLGEMQEETMTINQAIYDRLAILESKQRDAVEQQRRSLDLYLNKEFPRDMLHERKERLEEVVRNLKQEQADIAANLQTNVISDEEIAEIEAFCAELRDKLDNATSELNISFFLCHIHIPGNQENWSPLCCLAGIG